MRRQGILHEPTVKNWKLGFITFDYMVGEKVRRFLWAFITTMVMAIVITAALAVGNHFLTQRIGNADLAFTSTKIAALLIGLGMLGFASLLVWDMHSGTTIPPLFSDIVAPFPPRKPPKDDDVVAWNMRLRKGVRIGRWQVTMDRHRNRPGHTVWMPLKGMPGIFCAGEAGMGKSTFLWGVMEELEDEIRAGYVKISLFDYKMGMEMDAATAACVCGDCDSHSDFKVPKQPMVEKENFHYGQDVGTHNTINGIRPQEAWWRPAAVRSQPWSYEETAIPPLFALVQTMRQRGKDWRGTGREHIAKPGDPHWLVIVDEAAQFARDHVPTYVQMQIAGLFDTLANQARALGFSVIVCTQYPSLEHIKFRHGLLWGLCLKVKTPRACDMVMGEGSWQKGKKADRLPRDQKGVGYLGESGPYGSMPLRLALNGPEIEPWRPDPEPTSDEIELMPVRQPELEVEPNIDVVTGEVFYEGQWQRYPNGES